jgi:Protein of unknown function (DUF664).
VSNISAPSSDEYAASFQSYVERVPPGSDIIELLSQQMLLLPQLLQSLSDDEALVRPAPDAWSIKQIVGHLSDCERVFAYRALCAMRNDRSPLASFDQDAFVAAANFDQRSLDDLLEEWIALRQATYYAFRYLSDEASQRRGLVDGHEASVRAWLYINAGHTEHHIRDLKLNMLRD